ncbi:MAG: hypothetical protein A2V65_00770 [Deltaproteobacteria bacterium RBG_13_49_15]|nr:MAG: hypothetical protein A2V65_00770 [Deltaproteobacteria bacterium RBG_13_49_15]
MTFFNQRENRLRIEKPPDHTAISGRYGLWIRFLLLHQTTGCQSINRSNLMFDPLCVKNAETSRRSFVP